MKRLFKFKYPKITLWIIMIILAYFLFKNSNVSNFVSNLGLFGYIGIFIAGMLFSFGFTVPFAVGFFILLNPGNIFLAGIIGGFGALISDLFIFSFIRMSFLDEFNRLEHTEVFKEIHYLINNFISHRLKNYLMYAFAGIIIASPLPDEIGVMMLAGLTKINVLKLSLISFTFNTLGILIILLLSV